MQILEATAYIHIQGIIHRDLKPENIMFAQDVETNIESEDLLKAFNVKIIDLGMSAYYEPNAPLKGNKYRTTSIGLTASHQPLACAFYCAYAGRQHAVYPLIWWFSEHASFLWFSSPALAHMLTVRIVLCSSPYATHKMPLNLGLDKALAFCIEAVRREWYYDCQALHKFLLTITTAIRALWLSW